MQNEFLQVKFGADTKEVEKAVKTLERKVEEFGNSLSAVGDRLTLSITAPLTALAGKMIMTSARAEETRSKFDAVFKDLASETRAWASETALAFQRSSISLEGYLAQLQDTFVPMGVARDKAQELSKVVATLGIDLASFNNKADEEVINNLTSALVGNSEAVRSYGISLTEASLNQELLSMGIEGGVRKSDELTKMMARLNIMLRSTTDAQGDAVRTADSFTNQLKGLQAEVEMTNVAFGDLLVDSLRPVVAELRELFAGFTRLDESIKQQVITYGILSAGAGLVLSIFGRLLVGLGKIAKFAKANPFVAIAVGVASFGVKLGIAEVGLRDVLKRLDEFSDEGNYEGFNNAMGEANKRLAELRLKAYDIRNPLSTMQYLFHRLTGTVGELEQEVKLTDRTIGQMKFAELKTALNEADWTTIVGVLEDINVELDNFKSKIDGVADPQGLGDIVIGLELLRKQAERLLTNLPVVKPKVEPTVTAPDLDSDLAYVMSSISQGITEGLAEIEYPVGSIGNLTQVLSELRERQMQLTDPEDVQMYGKEIEGLEQKIREMYGVFDEPNEIIPEGSLRALERSLFALREAQSLVTDSEAYQVYQQQIEQVQESIDNITGKGKELAEEFNGFQMAYVAMGNILADAFTDAIVQGKKLTDVLENLTSYILSSGIRFLLSTLLTGGLSGSGFFGQGGGLFGNLFGSLFKNPVTDAVASTTGVAMGQGLQSVFVPSALNDAGELNVVVRGQLKGQDIFLSNERGGQSYSR